MKPSSPSASHPLKASSGNVFPALCTLVAMRALSLIARLLLVAGALVVFLWTTRTAATASRRVATRGRHRLRARAHLLLAFPMVSAPVAESAERIPQTGFDPQAVIVSVLLGVVVLCTLRLLARAPQRLDTTTPLSAGEREYLWRRRLDKTIGLDSEQYQNLLARGVVAKRQLLERLEHRSAA